MIGSKAYDGEQQNLAHKLRSVSFPVGVFPSRKRPVITVGIIVLNVIVYAITSYGNFFLQISDYWVSAGGFFPSLIGDAFQWYRILFSMFLHADFFHILFNMYFLYIFGRAVENALGGSRYLVLYIVSGVVASLFHTAFSFLGGAGSYVVPAIGASGAISGVLGAYLMLYPGTSLVMGWFFFMFPMFFRLKASYYLIFWFATQVIYGYAKLSGNTAVFAHVGGFIAGIALLQLVADKHRMSQFKLLRNAVFPPYLFFSPPKTAGLGRPAKASLTVLLISLLVGAAYASVGPINQGGIKSATVRYDYEGTPYMDYVGFQLPNIEPQIASISLDTTRILLSRLNAIGMLYDKAKADKEVGVSGLNFKLRVGGINFPVNLTINYFKGLYDNDGFLNYGEGNLTTQVVIVYPYSVNFASATFTFQFSSRTVNLKEITQYAGFSSLLISAATFVTVVKKDKELALIGEDSGTFSRSYEPFI